MQKYLLLYLPLLIILSFSMPKPTFANTFEQDDNPLDSIHVEHLTHALHELAKNHQPDFQGNRNLYDQTNSLSSSFSFKNIFHAAMTSLFAEWIEQRYLLTSLFFLVLIASLIQQIQSDLEASAIVKLSNYMIYVVLFSFMLRSFYTVCMYGKATLDQMNDWMIALLPLLVSITAMFGQILTITFFQPIVLFLIFVSSTLITRFIYPLLMLAAILHLLSYFHEAFKVTQLAALLRKISLYILGVFTSLFFAVLSVQGTVASISDGIAIKATKFMTSNFVPVIGRTMTEGVDTLLSASLLAKNAIGVFGLTILFLILLFPVIKMFAIAFMYQIVAACLEPLTINPTMTESLVWMSKYMFYTLATILVMASLYFITLLLFIVATNIPLLVK